MVETASTTFFEAIDFVATIASPLALANNANRNRSHANPKGSGRFTLLLLDVAIYVGVS